MSYRVENLRPLPGLGANGDLYIGQRSDNGGLVVVKYLRDCWLPHARKAFAREVKVLQRRLRGMVPLLFAVLDAKRPYYVMPYISGGALTRYAGKLNGDQLQNVALALAHTLETLHSALEAHGDFKPDNIFVNHDGRLQVGDPLGNGSIFTMLFSENRGGTPGYCAPEIRFSGGSISREGDVYSYGATLYHLLTGQRPRDGERFDVQLENYGNFTKMWEIISACCQRDPRSRPTIGEVLLMLNGVRWTDVVEQRRQRSELLKVGVVIAIGFVLITTLAGGGQG